MREFVEGFKNVLDVIHWPSLSLYELGEYAGAGVVGALVGMLVIGSLFLACAVHQKIHKGKG
jgi:H+/Cl- antiporter ClcA